MFDKCLHPGSNLQLTPPCDHCSNALPSELLPLLRNYQWNFVNYRKQIKYCGEFYWNFPFLIFNDNDYDVVLFKIPTRYQLHSITFK